MERLYEVKFPRGSNPVCVSDHWERNDDGGITGVYSREELEFCNAIMQDVKGMRGDVDARNVAPVKVYAWLIECRDEKRLVFTQTLKSMPEILDWLKAQNLPEPFFVLPVVAGSFVASEMDSVFVLPESRQGSNEAGLAVVDPDAVSERTVEGPVANLLKGEDEDEFGF